MKLSLLLLTTTVLLLSCNKHKSRATAAPKKSVSSEKSMNNEDFTITDRKGRKRVSRYANKDFTRCLRDSSAERASDTPSSGGGLSAFRLFANPVDLQITKETISSIIRDINTQLKQSGRFSPQNFWQSLSANSVYKLMTDLINAYPDLSDSEFEKKKQMIAYAFLYYVEQRETEVSYSFNFNSNEDQGESDSRETISFNGSDEVDDAHMANVCSSLKIEDINTNNETLSAADSSGKMICTDGENQLITLTKIGQETLVLKINNDSEAKYKEFKMDLSEILFSTETIDEHEITPAITEISHDTGGFFGYPTVSLKLKRVKVNTFEDDVYDSYYLPERFKGMDVNIITSHFSSIDFDDMNCRTLKEFDLNI